MELEVIQRRKGLPRTLRALKNGSVTLGFIGGSITEPVGTNRWPEYVTNWFVEQFPGVRIYVENAAIGATGSDLAVFRAERDLISRGCDIVFIEYTVNDNDAPKERRMRSREGLIRKLLAEERDLVLVYTFFQPMYEEMIKGKVPDLISEFEVLGTHYGIGSVWMGLHALNEVKKGWMRWEEWLPDTLHPEHRGSLSYAQSVMAYLEKELVSDINPQGIPAGNKLPAPYDKNNWEKTSFVPFERMKLQGSWTVRRWASLKWIDQVLDTAAVGARLSFTFEGRGLALGFDFGTYSSEFRYRLDQGEWTEMVRERPYWCPDKGWFRISDIADDLPEGQHEFELEVTHGNREGCKGTNFRMAFAGVIV